MIEVIHITQPQHQEIAYRIRETVFVHEQQVPANAEYDEFETSSRHFLAFADGIPCGTARWRYTDKGIKLERFAVLKEFRGRCVGSALVRAVLADIQLQPVAQGKILYLHGQLSAMPLYRKFGFEPVGDMFEECNIQHFKMIRKPGLA
ncbi:GNAT family N-acetyltransferase [Rhodocytophaga aerolata]|uniref:GNAT family N-acetyltransferase n=1 Tax=Rhodocytophaga aerolata TaxID=455078 RepID=A0ABT8RAM8_9BACT|nr:GNAT family N-acetyltransferase [Rhodocytophaga aerolata]MDO1448736.1 GNAT family N-acetyltransferase [Rhodocytophaga aerolata]